MKLSFYSGHNAAAETSLWPSYANPFSSVLLWYLYQVCYDQVGLCLAWKWAFRR